jgi:hypothetical protein
MKSRYEENLPTFIGDLNKVKVDEVLPFLPSVSDRIWGSLEGALGGVGLKRPTGGGAGLMRPNRVAEKTSDAGLLPYLLTPGAGLLTSLLTARLLTGLLTPLSRCGPKPRFSIHSLS